MRKEFTSWSLFLYLILFMKAHVGNGAREVHQVKHLDDSNNNNNNLPWDLVQDHDSTTNNLPWAPVEDDSNTNNLFWTPNNPHGAPVEDDSNTINLFWAPVKDDSNTNTLPWDLIQDDNTPNNLPWAPVEDDRNTNNLFWAPVKDDRNTNTLPRDLIQDDSTTNNLFWASVEDDSNTMNLFWALFKDDSNTNTLSWAPIQDDRNTNNLQRADQSMNRDHVNVHNHNHNINPKRLNLFFSKEDLTLGKRMPVNFQIKKSSTDPLNLLLLTKEEAKSIPFSHQQLQNILQRFSIPEGSTRANSIEQTLHVCRAKQLKGEIKSCPTSLESMLDFVQGLLGPIFKILSTNHLTRSKAIFQNYTIQEKPEFVAVDPKMVACHAMPYPYAVFFCHTPDGAKPFKLSLVGDNGDRTESVGVCHENTSEWSPNHIAFRVLGTKPGAEVCHFLCANNLLFVPI